MPSKVHLGEPSQCSGENCSLRTIWMEQFAFLLWPFAWTYIILQTKEQESPATMMFLSLGKRALGFSWLRDES